MASLGRKSSVRRTASNVNLDLAAVDLPEPSRITDAARRSQEQQTHKRVISDLSDAPNLGEPSTLKAVEDEYDEDAQEALQEAISGLALGDPEKYIRANMRADGAKTPEPRARSESNTVLSPPTSPQTSRTSRLPSVSRNVIVPLTSTSQQQDSVAIDATTGEQIITPWDVEGATVDGKQVAIDYNKLVQNFGTKLIDDALLARFEKVTGRKAHLLLRRGIFFSHRELDRILNLYEAGKQFYLYTGRGPSSDSLHLGHMLPFTFTSWLQDVFDCPLVIQLTDDEKFLFKPALQVDQVHKFSFDTARQIIACGFKADKTFIFSDLDYMGGAFYKNVLRIARLIPYNQSKATFGFTDSDNIGKSHFVAVQAAPSFSNSFPQIYGTQSHIPCLIPCAIDQDAYFRLTRDVASRLKYPKPALMHSKFFPSLLGPQSKMSASNSESSIYMSDTPNQIKNKINRYAFSGGQETAEEQRRLGGNPDVDVSFNYLRHFLEDDERLKTVEEDYRAGRMMTGELKKLCIEVLQKYVAQFQQNKAAITDDMVRSYMDPTRKIDPTMGKPAA